MSFAKKGQIVQIEKIEQRIGRIDRIGQKADKLRIYNLTCQNTIEDKILERLYERVDIFKNSMIVYI